MAKDDKGSEDGSDEVGYAKPPKSKQFRKGVSGNPTGRPKGSKNMSSILTKVGRERVKVTSKGKTRLITKHEAYVLQLSNRAANGDLKAGRDLLTALRLFPAPQEAAGISAVPTQRDEAAVKSFLDRLRNAEVAVESKVAPQISEAPEPEENQ